MRTKEQFDKEYLKRCKYSSPESKFEWMMEALLFAKEKKKIVKEGK